MSETTHIGSQVATDLLYWTACRFELWDSDAVFNFHNSKFGGMDIMLTNLICMHILEKKQTLVFLIYSHFAVTTVLSNVLSNHFFHQNKLTITFNKMITSGKSD